MVEIECLACSKTLKIPECINTDKYDGQIVCQECKSLLYIKLIKGKVEKSKVVENKLRETLDPNLVLEFFRMIDQKKRELDEIQLKEDKGDKEDKSKES